MILHRLSANSEGVWRVLSLALFACLVIVILTTFRDYGLTWDEAAQRAYGDYVLHWYGSFFQDRSALNYLDLYLYGGFFEIVAQSASHVLPFGVYETRHLINALFGLITIVAAYKTGAHLLGSMGGFLSALFLTLTPVFYGHSFNNPKDVPFAALCAVALYFILRSWDELPRVSGKLMAKLGISFGLAMGVRVGGVIMLGYLALLWMAWLLTRLSTHSSHVENSLSHTSAFVRLSFYFACIVLLAWAIMLLFWPWAQINPLVNPVLAMRAIAHYQWPGEVFFGGRMIRATELPWTYLPTWLAISLPEFYFVAPLAGCFVAIKLVIKRNSFHAFDGRILKVCLLVFALCFPVALAITLRSTIYDGLRQFLFIIPPLAVLSGISVASLFTCDARKPIKLIVAGAIMLSIGMTVYDMINLHPYQTVYFNRSVAGGLTNAARSFETDYWGNSYREGAMWIAQNYDPDFVGEIRVANCSSPILTGYFLDRASSEHRRFVTVAPQHNPHLFLATTRYGCQRNVAGNILHIVERQGTPLLYVIEAQNPREVTQAPENVARAVAAPNNVGTITATPNPVPAGNGTGLTTITWNTGSDSVGEVFMSENGGDERLFARGSQGSSEVPWIGYGSTYDFRLYSTTEPRTLLASVRVVGSTEISGTQLSW